MSEIISIWESPTNEGTECFRTGGSRYGYKHPQNWTIGRIFGPHLDTGRIMVYEVYDQDGNLRASLPAAACGVEREP